MVQVLYIFSLMFLVTMGLIHRFKCFTGLIPTIPAGYCASKGGVVNLTRQVAIDYAKQKIHCNALCPGFTETAMSKANMESEEISTRLMSLTPMNEWGKKGDVAKAALFLASEDAAYVTGVALPVDGGMVAQ
ncbi:MAG: hypothetical protein Q9181_002507 [Wetmoreana brouardii]